MWLSDVNTSHPPLGCGVKLQRKRKQNLSYQSMETLPVTKYFLHVWFPKVLGAFGAPLCVYFYTLYIKTWHPRFLVGIYTSHKTRRVLLSTSFVLSVDRAQGFSFFDRFAFIKLLFTLCDTEFYFDQTAYIIHHNRHYCQPFCF